MATKEQERKVLAQIRKLVEGLGDDSYIGWAFEGCFEVAEQNIENDWACSMKQRAEGAEKKLGELERKYTDDMAHLKASRDHLQSKCEAKEQQASSYLQDGMRMASEKRELESKVEQMENDMDAMRATVEAADEKLEQKDVEIMKLKAKLYDLMMK